MFAVHVLPWKFSVEAAATVRDFKPAQDLVPGQVLGVLRDGFSGQV